VNFKNVFVRFNSQILNVTLDNFVLLRDSELRDSELRVNQKLRDSQPIRDCRNCS